MMMKKFWLNTLGLTILIFTISATTNDNGKKVIHYVSNSGELSTTIKIPEYKDSLKLMQITDVHISIADEKESDLMKYGDRMHKAYGSNPLFYSVIIKGINFVGIDNSIEKVNNRQVEFLKDQLKRKEPIVLLSHIPYNLNNGTDQPDMIPMIDLISSNSNKIIAIFAGHIHRSSFYFTGNLCQYTSLAAFQEGSFNVYIKPASH